MEGVDHIHVVQVCCCRFIGQIYRMTQRDIPDGEGFKLRIARLYPSFVLMVQLRKAGRHLAAAGAGCCQHHQRTLCFNIIIFAKAFFAYDQRDIGRIAFDGVMFINLDPQSFQFLFISHHAGLTVKLGQNHTAHIQTIAAEGIDQAQYIRIVSDAQIAAHLVFFNITCADDNNDFRIILQLYQHIDLTVRLKAGQHTGCMVIIKQLAAEFQIQLAAELSNSFFDMLRLHLQVFIIIKSNS